MGPRLDEFVDFDIDNYISRFVPPSQLGKLPRPVSRWLGYREEEYQEPPHLIVCFWSFIGAISGVLLIGGLYKYAPGLAKYNPPVMVASLVSQVKPAHSTTNPQRSQPLQGASAILDYNSIRTPLAQPRNAFFGQTFSAIIGVVISKGFQNLSNFDDIQWIAAAVCCATASFVMSVTNTVHPPGGATSILAATNTQVIRMGWIYVPFIMMSSVLMLTVGLIVNNIQRGYPVYWWTPRDLRKAKDVDLEKIDSNDSEEVLRGHSVERTASGGADAIVVSPHHLFLPDMFDLDSDEIAVLHRLQARLRWDLALDERPSLSGSDP